MIKQFVDSYRFLSNFYPCTIYWYRWTTVEHVYQASKAKRDIDFNSIINAPTPAKAKRLGRQVELVDDWESIKMDTMYQLLSEKFSERNPHLLEGLLSTGNEELQEGNRWGDTFWGVDLDTGIGDNNLGKLLMKIRNDRT